LKVTSPNAHLAFKCETLDLRPTNSASAASSLCKAPSIALSPTARALSHLSDTGDDINVQNVQFLRDAIASGELKVNASRIADGLLDTARNLIEPQK